MTYTYEQFDMRPGADNSGIISRGNLYGLEVTVPVLAEACDLGNLDPQHLGGNASRAAIEDAMVVDLPSAEATLVTVRPDADSIGAMAVLLARQQYGDSWIEKPGVSERIRIIADGDKEASGDWPGPKPIERPEDLVTPFTVVNTEAMDFKKSMADRVASLREWLSTGTFESEADVKKHLEAEAAVALKGLEIVVRASGLAVVVGNHRLAMQFGYSAAPIVVATNPTFRFGGGEPHRKHTGARWNSAVHMQWDETKAELNDKETGWGGSSSIMGSPQGQNSVLSTEEVVEVFEKHL